MTATDDGPADDDGTRQVLVPTSLNSPAVEMARRIVIAVALAFGVFLLVLAAKRDDTTIEKDTGDPRVVAQFPVPDAQAPSQTQVGIQLAEGYDGVIAINGTPIPEEQLDGARDPSTLTAAQLEQYGIRPNNRNRLFFTPGPDKVFESIPKGEVTVTVSYHRDRQPGVETGSSSWTFIVQ